MNSDVAVAQCLIVDDSSVVRKVAARILSDCTGTIEEAATAAAALHICAGHMPDLIILDADLPDMGSIEVITAIRDMPDGKRPCIVLCLYELDLSHVMRARRAGVDSHILKPFDRGYLLQQFASWRRAA